MSEYDEPATMTTALATSFLTMCLVATAMLLCACSEDNGRNGPGSSGGDSSNLDWLRSLPRKGEVLELGDTKEVLAGLAKIRSISEDRITDDDIHVICAYLAAAGDTPEGRQFVVENFDNFTSESIRALVALGLVAPDGKCSTNVRKFLDEAPKSANPRVRRIIAAPRGPDDKRGIPQGGTTKLLADLAAAKTINQKGRLIEALGGKGDPAAIPALIKYMRNPLSQQLRFAACHSIDQIGYEKTPLSCLDSLLVALEGPVEADALHESSVTECILACIAAQGGKGARAVPAVKRRLLSSKQDGVAMHAVRTLVALGPEGIKALREVTESDNPIARTYASIPLRELEKKTRE